jgi:MipA family protein
MNEGDFEPMPKQTPSQTVWPSMKVAPASALALLGAAALLVPASPAAAQSEQQSLLKRVVTVGVGIQRTPEFPGGEMDRWAPWPIIRFQRTDAPVRPIVIDDGFGPISLVKVGPMSLGPHLSLHQGRDEEDVGVPIGDVSTTVELGMFAQADLSDNFRLRGHVRKGIGGHKGWVGDVGGDVFLNAGRLHLSAGPRLRLGDAGYMRSFYGVDTQQSIATGLALHDPSGGIHSIGATAGALYRLGGGIGLHGYARYDRLVGNASDSPIVLNYGTRDQLSVGIGLSYSFGL